MTRPTRAVVGLRAMRANYLLHAQSMVLRRLLYSGYNGHLDKKVRLCKHRLNRCARWGGTSRQPVLPDFVHGSKVVHGLQMDQGGQNLTSVTSNFCEQCFYS